MNPFSMMKDAKNMEKMMKPALEKFMKEAGFIKKEVPNSYVFNPCDIRSLVGFLENDKTSSNFDRERFKTKFSRSTINKQLSANIINYI